jgi:hypothetical protein
MRPAPDTLDFTRAIIVNREQLAEALKDACHVSAVLRNIENLDDLSLGRDDRALPHGLQRRASFGSDV